MGQRRKVNVRKLTPRHDKDYYRRHKASPWMLEWRDPFVRDKTGKPKVTRLFKADEATAIKYQRRIEDHINTADRDPWFVRVVSLEYASERFTDRPGLGKETVRSYKITLARYAEICGNPSSDRWVVGTINRYITVRLKAGASAPTINKDLRALSAFFSWAKAMRLCEENPFDRLPHGHKRLREPQKIHNVWTPAEFKQCLKHCSPQWQAMAYLCLCGAGRLNTLRKLRGQDVNLDGRYIIVCESKTQKSRRAPLHPKAILAMKKYRNPIPMGAERIFTSSFRAEQWKAICEKAKLPHVTLHHMRRCMASWLAEQGTRDEDIAIVLDHSSPAVTRKHYQQLQTFKIRQRTVASLPL